MLRTAGRRQLTDELDLAVVLDVVEGHADARRLSVQNGKLAAVGLPGERYDALCKRNTRSQPRQGNEHIGKHTQ